MKTYKSKLGALSITRSGINSRGDRVSLPSIEFNQGDNCFSTGSADTQEYLENHPNFGRYFVLVEQTPGTDEKASEQSSGELGKDDSADTEHKEFSKLQELADYLESKDVDTSGLRSWADMIALAKSNGLNVKQA